MDTINVHCVPVNVGHWRRAGPQSGPAAAAAAAVPPSSPSCLSFSSLFLLLLYRPAYVTIHAFPSLLYFSFYYTAQHMSPKVIDNYYFQRGVWRSRQFCRLCKIYPHVSSLFKFKFVVFAAPFTHRTLTFNQHKLLFFTYTYIHLTSIN
jgi:hypothetical protein